jgi:hypothetical protein
VFIGNVTAAGTSNTLRLASAASTGTISSIGTAFTGFGTVSEDSGAKWTVNGANSVATLVNKGTMTIGGGARLTVTTAIDPSSTGTFNLSASSTIEVAAAAVSTITMSFISPSKLIVDHAAQFGTNVGSPSYAGPLLKSFTGADAVDFKDLVPTGLTLVYATATGLLQVNSGTIGVASLKFENATLGSGSFHIWQRRHRSRTDNP